jgi:hypothetical protein
MEKLLLKSWVIEGIDNSQAMIGKSGKCHSLKECLKL